MTEARYMENDSRFDAIRMFFDEGRAVDFARETGGYIASQLDNGDVVMYEVRYLRRRAL